MEGNDRGTPGPAADSQAASGGRAGGPDGEPLPSGNHDSYNYPDPDSELGGSAEGARVRESGDRHPRDADGA